jgi:hypothetical protein
VSNPTQTDADGDGFGDACDNCPTVFNPAQSDGNANGTGDLCDLSTTIPAPFALKQVKLKAAGRQGNNATILVRGTLDATELASAQGSLTAALHGGFTVGVIGAGLSVPQKMLFPGSSCLDSRKAITCVGSRGEEARFQPAKVGGLFAVKIAARNYSFSPPLAAAPVQVVLSAGGLDRQDRVGCKASAGGKAVDGKK